MAKLHKYYRIFKGFNKEFFVLICGNLWQKLLHGFRGKSVWFVLSVFVVFSHELAQIFTNFS